LADAPRNVAPASSRMTLGTGSAAEVALTRTEINLLDRLVNDRGKAFPRRKTIGTYLTKIARLGGYLARATDPPPGNMVMWRDCHA
jgi:hypothetical protein